MKKLSVILLATLISGCSSTEVNVDTTALDLTNDKSKVESYWISTKTQNPVYPPSAAREDISGCVEFLFVIAQSGKAQNIQLVKSVPKKTFDSAALKSLKKFRWEPSASNTSKTSILTTIQLDFSTVPQQLVTECTLDKN